MHLGLLGRELAAAHELGDERVVVGQLLELAVAQQVGARVADVADRRRCRRPATSATVIVVPIPEAAASLSARSWTRRFAAWISSTTTLLGAPGRVERRVSRSALGGERRGDLAGLGAAHPVGDREERRVADVGVLVVPALAAGVRARPTPARSSSLEPQVGLADPDDVAGGEAALARQPDPVDERAVRRADVLDVDAVAARLEAGVVRRGVLVALEREVVVAAAPDASARSSRSRRRPPRSSAGLCDDDEPAELARERLREERRGLLGREDHRLLRQAQVAGGRADDPPDEEVEEDEEGDLEDKERGLDLNRSQRHGLSGSPGRR